MPLKVRGTRPQSGLISTGPRRPQRTPLSNPSTDPVWAWNLFDRQEKATAPATRSSMTSPNWRVPETARRWRSVASASQGISGPGTPGQQLGAGCTARVGKGCAQLRWRHDDRHCQNSSASRRTGSIRPCANALLAATTTEPTADALKAT